MRRARTIILILLVPLFLAFAFIWAANHRNRAEIRTRYAELRAALSAADTNAVLALIAPTYRSSFDGGRFMRLDAFARPLEGRSKVLVVGGAATVWPKPNWYLCGVFPIGNTVEMT